MSRYFKAATGLLALIAFMHCAYGISVDGGTSSSLDRQGRSQGSLVADEDGVVSLAFSTVPVALGQTYYVQDMRGRRAEIMLDVVNGQIAGYKSEFVPRKGTVTPRDKIAAKQTLDIRDADKITASARAWNAAGDKASVVIQADRVETCGAAFVGVTGSYATASSAGANMDGNIRGAFTGTATAKNAQDVVRDSRGTAVDCDIVMNANSVKKVGSIVAEAAFNIYPGMMIQSGVDIAVDGDSVNVAPGTYIENVEVDKSLSINGAGIGDTIVDGGGIGSVFTTSLDNPDAEVVLSGMTIQNGLAIENGGGGINNMGMLTVKDCLISGNTAYNGGGIYNTGVLAIEGSEISGNIAENGSGGGIFNAGNATVIGSKINGNQAYDSGGGIYNQGTLTAEYLKISDNVGYNGGGICNVGTATLSDSEVSSNSGGHFYADGAGIWNNDILNIARCVISGNYGTFNGGGIWNSGVLSVTDSEIVNSHAWLRGGGIYNTGVLAIEGSEISGNIPEHGAGGGIFNAGNTTVIGSKINGNQAYDSGGGICNQGILTVKDSEIAGNVVYLSIAGSECGKWHP